MASKGSLHFMDSIVTFNKFKYKSALIVLFCHNLLLPIALLTNQAPADLAAGDLGAKNALSSLWVHRACSWSSVASAVAP